MKVDRLTFAIERVLPWRERGWVTADTHVHFLSPGSALLEGAGGIRCRRRAHGLEQRTQAAEVVERRGR